MSKSLPESTRFTLASLPVTGIEIAKLIDLTSERATANDFKRMHFRIQNNFGSQASTARILELRRILEEQGWSGNRVEKTTTYFLMHQRFEAWTIADFMAMPSSSLHPWSWVLEEVHKDQHAMKRMEGFKVGDVPLYRYADGSQLPFEKVYPIAPKPKNVTPQPPTKDRPSLRKLFEEERRTGATSVRDILSH